MSEENSEIKGDPVSWPSFVEPDITFDNFRAVRCFVRELTNDQVEEFAALWQLPASLTVKDLRQALVRLIATQFNLDETLSKDSDKKGGSDDGRTTVNRPLTRSESKKRVEQEGALSLLAQASNETVPDSVILGMKNLKVPPSNFGSTRSLPKTVKCRPQELRHNPRERRQVSNRGRDSPNRSGEESEDSEHSEGGLRPLGSFHLRALFAWKIKFLGTGENSNPEVFLDSIEEFAETYNIEFDRLLKALPVVLDSEAKAWYRVAKVNFHSWADFKIGIRSNFGPIDFQCRLESEVRTRTQGATERICAYINGMRLMFNHFREPWSVESQLSLIYRNLHPTFRRNIERRCVTSYERLESLGRELELDREFDREYRPPPTASSSIFPEAACRDRKEKVAGNRVAATDEGGTPPTPAPRKKEKKENRASRLKGEATEVAAGTVAAEVKPAKQVATANSARGPKPRKGVKEPARQPAWPTYAPAPQTSYPYPYPFPYPMHGNLPSPYHQPQPHPILQANPTPTPVAVGRPVAAPRPRVTGPCHNCGQVGHFVRECPFGNMGLKCYRCGTPGYTVHTCPSCSGAPVTGN